MSSFKVIYDSNNGQMGFMEPTVVKYGEITKLRKNKFSSDNMVFKGWCSYRVSDHKVCYQSPDGKQRIYYLEGYQPDGWTKHIYRDGVGVAKLSKIDNDTIIMYAQWEIDRQIIDNPIYSEDNKGVLRNKLLNRPIVLFGAGDRCRNFYQRYRKILNIRCIVTDKKAEKELVLKDGTKIPVEQYSKDKIQPDDYIVVCRPVKVWFDAEYENARRILTNDGFSHMKDFLRIGVARVLLDRKKLWLWMGFCQFDTLRDIFGKLDSVKNEYVVMGCRVGKDTVKTSYKYQDCIDMMKICDVLVYSPLIFAEGKVDFNYSEYIPQDAKTVSIPRIAFRGYYPYKDHDIDIHHKYTYDGDLHWPYSYAENCFDELILQGLTDDEIYEKVMRDDFISEEVILKNLKIAYKSIQISERTSDIKILDYIQENFTKRMLYRDGLHYKNYMYFEIARRLANQLELNCIEEINAHEKLIEEEGTEYIDFTEIPVLPCVAKTLGLDFITDETLWRVKFTDKGKYRGTDTDIRLLTRKEWIYGYISYTRAQMALLELWNKENYVKKGQTP